MSQPVQSGTAGPTAMSGTAISTTSTVTTSVMEAASVGTTTHADTAGPADAIASVDAQKSTRRARSARIRQISVLGLFTSLAMVSVRVPAVIIVPVMIVVLAGIDIVGAIAAKSWALGRSPWAFAAGVALFVLLFWVYGMSLRHGELSTITIGWVVLVTLADMGLDRFHYDVHFPLSKWIAALAAVALLAYLLVGTNGPAETSRSTPAGTAPSTVPANAPITVPAIDPITVETSPRLDSGAR